MDAQKADISVLIPTYNRAESTEKSILSVIDQTLPVREIIVVDDASQPPFKYTDRRIKIIRSSANGGPAHARNIGIEAAQGEWLAFLDSDDVWEPTRIANVAAILNDAPKNSAVGCGFRYIDTIRNRDHSTIPPSADSVSDFSKGCWFNPGSCAIIRKEDFDTVGPYNANMRRLEDYEWFLRFALLGGQLVIHPEILVEIHKGKRPSPTAIENARAHILPLLEKLDAKSYKFSQAYLEMELASASAFSGDYLKAASALARSFIYYPRLRLQPVVW